ncbi:MAG: hypothetical protein SGI84_10215, partial [Gemmatimonadota bacterium]|nr:hypothetical protein [Gemmatimonadota bacterium]
AAVGSSRLGFSLPGGGDAGLLGGSIRLGAGGVEATPEMVGYLLDAETVLLTVVGRAGPDGAPLAVAVAGGSLEDQGAEAMLRKVRKHVRITTARPTGLITLTIQHRDSAVARALASGIVSESQRLFADVTSRQAGQFRQAQDARVDTAVVELTEAEEALLRFNEGNRVVTAGGRLALARGRLERAVLTAQSVYQSAINDRESARARELEVTPALAVVEPTAATLLLEDRQPVALAAFAGLLAGAGLFLLFFLVELMRAPTPVRS